MEGRRTDRRTLVAEVGITRPGRRTSVRPGRMKIIRSLMLLIHRMVCRFRLTVALGRWDLSILVGRLLVRRLGRWLGIDAVLMRGW